MRRWDLAMAACVGAVAYGVLERAWWPGLARRLELAPLVVIGVVCIVGLVLWRRER